MVEMGIARGLSPEDGEAWLFESAVARWFSGRTAPNLLHASFIAEYLQISLDYLVDPAREEPSRGRETVPHDAHPRGGAGENRLTLELPHHASVSGSLARARPR